ncbi:MAG: hypothetical protein AAF675_18470, partial [Pseudomonadota bacterium]
MMRFANHSAATSSADATRLDRRTFLRATGGVTAGLLIGYGKPTAALGAGDSSFTPFIRIAPDGVITVLSKHLDK